MGAVRSRFGEPLPVERDMEREPVFDAESGTASLGPGTEAAVFDPLLRDAGALWGLPAL
jgi:hypothetical protein